MTVSVALIVKNEERSLARCLDSFAGAVDEIVVVDTGSTDATKEIARRYTSRLYDFEWRQDFAAARQYAFDRATAEWVAWVDADDVVRHADRIRPLLDAAPADVDGFYWPYEYDSDDWGNVVCEFWRERCVRNNGAFRWAGRVHEVLAEQRPCTMVRSSEVVVEHRRDPRSVPQKLRRNLDILEDEYAAVCRDGQKPSSRLLFYLASEYTSAGESQKALSLFHQYLQVSDWGDERYLAQTRVADIFRRQGRYEQAISADLQALRICPHWPDAYFGLAETYYYQRDWHKVVHWTELGRAMPRPDTLHILNPLGYSFHWIIFYTNALYHLGQTREALDWTRRALALRPEDEWHRENFLTFSRALQEDERAASFSGRTVERRSLQALPPAPAGEEARRPLRVVWEGPQFMRGSFAFVNRQTCLALLRLDAQGGNAEPQEAGPPLELSIMAHAPFEFGPEEDPERVSELAARFDAPLSGPADVHVTLSYMPEPEQPREGKWVIYRPWEFSSMPRRWFDLFETCADEVWVPSRFVWRSFVESGVSPHKVQVVPHGFDPKIFNPRARPMPLRTEKGFKFLFLGGTIWRKGIDILLDAYTRAFTRADDVCLIVKDLAADGFYRDGNARASIIRLRDDPAMPEILYLTQDVRDREVAGIYRACDCLVQPFRGEGFALPVLEAMACALPVIMTRGGPCEDYCPEEMAYWIPARPVSMDGWDEHVETVQILEPDRDALVEQMRRVYERRGEARLKGAGASRHALQNHTWAHAAKIIVERLRHLSGREGEMKACAAELEYAGA